MDEIRSIDFTNKAWDVLYDAVDNNYFRERDAELIYSALKKRMKFFLKEMKLWKKNQQIK